MLDGERGLEGRWTMGKEKNERSSMFRARPLGANWCRGLSLRVVFFFNFRCCLSECFCETNSHSQKRGRGRERK